MKRSLAIACAFLLPAFRGATQDKPIEFADADLREAIGTIAKCGGVDVLVVASVQGKVTATVDPKDPTAARAAAAADEYGVLRIGGQPAEARKPAKDPGPLPDLTDRDVALAMKEVCDRAGGFRGSKEQFVDLICNCCQLDLVELDSGGIELRARTGNRPEPAASRVASPPVRATVRAPCRHLAPSSSSSLRSPSRPLPRISSASPGAAASTASTRRPAPAR